MIKFSVCIGGGKSLAFQLPCLTQEHGFTVVVSPLIALAKDQVNACLDRGIEAELFNSEVAASKRQSILSELCSLEPTLKLVYVTPEALQKPDLREALVVAAEGNTVVSFAIDEAHCASQWGHDFRWNAIFANTDETDSNYACSFCGFTCFSQWEILFIDMTELLQYYFMQVLTSQCAYRPAYLALANLREDFARVPVAAVTATATSAVIKEMKEILALKQPKVMIASFNRPNIEYSVRHKELLGDGSDSAVLQVQDLVAFIHEHATECGIIYARCRATCDYLAAALNDADLEASAYHAGMDTASRHRTQTDWTQGACNIVVATVAFGMGIDKADVRWVVHWNAATSLEGFYQESGRAGRDGQPSVSLLYASCADLQMPGSKTASSSAMASYCMEPCCRRKAILTYFGEKSPKCQQQTELPCDYCQNSKLVCKASYAVEEALQAKAIAETRPKTADNTDSHVLSGHCTSGNHRESASTAVSPSAPHGLSSPACPPQSRGVWRTAASTRPAPLKPLLSHKRKLQAIAAVAPGDDKHTGKVQRQESAGSQAEACSSGAVVPQANKHKSGVSNMKKPVLRTRFTVPFKAPRPAG